MRRETIIRSLQTQESALRHAGVSALFLFGSGARDDAGPASDVDLFFDTAPDSRLTLFDLIDLQESLQDALGTSVDLMTRAGLPPRKRGRIEADAVQVF